MDITERKITKIAREAEKLVVRTIKDSGIGTAEMDFIHTLRHNPGCTEAFLVLSLPADKAAVARRTRNLEKKGYLIRKPSPEDKRSFLLYPTKKAEELKLSKAEIESSFYSFLLSGLTDDEKVSFVRTLEKIYNISKAESRAGFPHFK